MSGETDLSVLLANMQPVLREDRYVFCSVGQDRYERLGFKPLGTFVEEEGTSLIITEEQARLAGFSYESSWACITLNVHSALSAVGFLAMLTGRLAQAGMSVNAVSAYYHDHLFVPWDKRNEAMEAINSETA